MDFMWSDPWLICTPAVENQKIPLTFPIKPSVNNNQDVLIAIDEIQRNSAIVRRLVNSFHCTRSQRIHRDVLCKYGLYSSRNNLLRGITCRSNQGTMPTHKHVSKMYVGMYMFVGKGLMSIQPILQPMFYKTFDAYVCNTL